MQPTIYNGNNTGGGKKIIIAMVILGLLIFGIFAFIFQLKENGKNVSSENEPALTYVNQFNSYMVSEPDKAYDEFSAQSKPERALFDASSSYFKSDIDVDKCKFENEKTYLDQVIEITIICPLKRDKTDVAIRYHVDKSTENFTILSYEFISE